MNPAVPLRACARPSAAPQSRMNFASDNIAGASQPVLDAIIAANAGASPGYGADSFSARAELLLREIFETDCTVALVATGTAANALALAAMTPPWGAVFCHAASHVNTDECGAPELFTGGAKLVGIAGQSGKMTANGLADALVNFPRGVMHHVQPGALTLSQATEAGTVYAREQIAALADVAHCAGMAVHMDGARFGNALVTLGCTAAEMTWKAGVDVLSFGATKNGALACEAVVFFKPEIAASFAYLRKRGGHVLSKSRFLGAQMAGYLEGGHWLANASAANAAAAQLEQGLKAIPGIRLPWRRGANEVFAVIPARIDAALTAAGAWYYPWHEQFLEPAERPAADEIFIRLIASFATTPSEVANFLKVAHNA